MSNTGFDTIPGRSGTHTNHRLSVKSLAAVAFLAILLSGIMVGHRVNAQDQSMDGHPLVGSWILTGEDGETSVTAVTSDGVIVDAEADGSSGIGSWEATSETEGAVTLIIQGNYPEFDFVGTVVVRGTLNVDTQSDTATLTYSMTGVSSDGAVAFADMGTASLIRLPIESVDAIGSPVAGYPTAAAEATPSS
jgi:hypothetical protein